MECKFEKDRTIPDHFLLDSSFDKEYEHIKTQLPKTHYCYTLNSGRGEEYYPFLVGSRSLEYYNTFYNPEWFKTNYSKQVISRHWEIVALTKHALAIFKAFYLQSKSDSSIKMEHKVEKINDKQALLSITVTKGDHKQQVLITVVDTTRQDGGSFIGSSDAWLLLAANESFLDYAVTVKTCAKEFRKPIYYPSNYSDIVDMVRGPLAQVETHVALMDLLYAKRCVEISSTLLEETAIDVLKELNFIRQTFTSLEWDKSKQFGGRKWGVQRLSETLTVSRYHGCSTYRKVLQQEFCKTPGTVVYINQDSERKYDQDDHEQKEIQEQKDMTISTCREKMEKSKMELVDWFQKQATTPERLFVIDQWQWENLRSPHTPLA